ncbi:hypothetical protein IQ07DRAFT_607633 [Pyrenochaeta sp. DS3sAY3a]|nr:hypothetical protein IQ07DRAFT_607633 [Pyrenochaeta sp. DS3sAY3a]
MAAPKLPFLWPMLFKPTKPSRIRTPASRAIDRTHPRLRQRECRHFTTTRRWSEEATIKRYGTAQEPAPTPSTSDTQKEPEQNQSENTTKPPESEDAPDEEPLQTSPPSTPTQKSTPAVDQTLPPQPAPEPPRTGDSHPLDSVLHMPGPQDSEQHKPPHLKTPPYVHHFDTYSLVRDLSRSAYTGPQSITLMKAVRQLLLTNMALARAGLVSKSNVENETYLFRAACSELNTEVGNLRKGENERMRTERGQLQHEVDILGQRLGQETGGLRDELKGLFDDRKMAVRQEQRVMETKIQELNYKITVALNSDARSEVEGLRWVLTRRAAITVGVSAFMLFVALRYTSYVQHQQQEEKRKAPPHRASPLEDLDERHVPAAVVGGSQEALGTELLATEGGSLG